MQRYHTQFGSNPEIKACITLAGPQDADQIPGPVKALLDMKGIKQVAVMFDCGLGERIQLYVKMNE